MARFTSTKPIPRKAQIWGLDLFMGVFILSIVLIFFLVYSIRLSSSGPIDVASLQEDGKTLSTYLVHAGYPQNWNQSTVIMIGLTDGDHRLDPEKIQMVDTLIQTDYQAVKHKLSMTNDFFVFFQDRDGQNVSINGISGFGKPGVTKDTFKSVEQPEHILKVTRFVIYDHDVILMVIYLWP